MRLSIVKFFFPIFFLAFSAIGLTGYGCDFSYDHFYDLEEDDFFESFETEAEFGASCYVQNNETVYFDLGPDVCEEEDDGSWGTDAPEGIFFHDHPDEEPTHPLQLWKALSIIGQRALDVTPYNSYALFPGAVYPPPQR